MDAEGLISAATTVRQLIDAVNSMLSDADLYYGHGTDNAADEAAALVFHVMSLDHAGAASQYERAVEEADRQAVLRLAELRAGSRKPLAYLLGEAWFCGLPFNVDERVLIPRSPIAELISDRFEPWLDANRVENVLEIGTGSGCIAIAAALSLPTARVTSHCYGYCSRSAGCGGHEYRAAWRVGQAGSGADRPCGWAYRYV